MPTSLNPPLTVQVGDLALSLRDVLPDDEDAVVALHTRVFGPDVDGHWFTWKYGRAPRQGNGQAVGIWHGSDLIGYCGGVPRALWRGTRCNQGLQIGDVMIHPQWRGILTRRGPFFHVSQRFYESRLGPAPNFPFQLGFGFPSRRHLRLAVLLGLLRDAGVVESLHWKTSGVAFPALWRWRALLPTDARFDRAVNHAWKSMHARAGTLTIGQRDATYVRWRYVERPDSARAATGARYRFFELHRPWSVTPTGIAVLDLRSTCAQWLDWIGPVDLMPLACLACRCEAMRAGAGELSAWASPVVSGNLANTGVVRREVCSGLGIPTRSDLDFKALESSQWWLMGGDTDFL